MIIRENKTINKERSNSDELSNTTLNDICNSDNELSDSDSNNTDIITITQSNINMNPDWFSKLGINLF